MSNDTLAYLGKKRHGNSHQRKQAKRQSLLSLPQPLPPPAKESKISKPEIKRFRFPSEAKNELLGIVSFACTVGSWGWTVIAPDSSVLFGSMLLFFAVVSFFYAAYRVFQWKNWIAVLLAILCISLFWMFDYTVVIKPQKGKQFKTLLVDGYHIASECEAIPAKSQMPQWMRDQSKEWQSKAEQLISDKLNYTWLQLWRGAVIVGRIDDENMNAYQCLWLSKKVGTLETIISANYDSTLKHRDYNGPTYWMNVFNGQVDVSDALNDSIKHHNGQADFYFNSDTAPPNQKSNQK